MERRGKGSFPCAYFAKEGFCVKGRHCEFVHERPAACKNFLSPEGCRFGSRCMFSHSRPKTENTSAKLTPRSVPTQEDPPDTINTTASPVERQEVEDPWGLGEPAESVYFYGAAGGGTIDRPKRYSEVLGRPSSEMEDRSSSTSTRKVCGFYRAGYCMFGERCRNLHPDDAGEPLALSIAGDQEERAECGICMSTPVNRVYGLLNNCNCVFCLDCIKNWRKEGLTFEDAAQVRQVSTLPLCPHSVDSVRSVEWSPIMSSPRGSCPIKSRNLILCRPTGKLCLPYRVR